MIIGVCIKSVPDTTAKIQVHPDASGIQEAGVKFVISPYDEYAVEQALRLKDEDANHEVVVFSFGGAKGPDALRSALAMGVDRAIFITDETGAAADGLSTAKVLQKAMAKENVEIVFTGRQAIDDDSGQVSQMIAEKLGWPHATMVSGFRTKGDATVEMTRDIEGGAKEIWQMPLQSVFACTKGLNDPRYPSLKGIMAAKKKPLATISIEDLGLTPADVASKITLSKFELPSVERKQTIFAEATQANVDALVKALREEAKVI
ncbi:MAG: electron transfer flavoprotein subunit beta/FixA family protein [Deltaproteobacteria bacterium]|nr:electron transfer flavoprotein subunit beta/FixA family protein [Deltaproteobacteria bacterium]